MPSAAILIVGDEILSGEVQDENAPYLVRVLSEAGVPVVRIVTAPDRLDDLVVELRHLRALAESVVVSGGIGPTHDDVTRPAIAATLGVPLEEHAEAAARIRDFYAGRLTEAERSMAWMPRGAELLSGPRTGTFGFAAGGVYVLPGVPFLLRDIAAGLTARLRAAPSFREEVRSNRREGEIAATLAAVQGRCQDVAIGSYPVCEQGRWHVRIVVRAGERARAAAVAEELRALLHAS